MEEIIRDSAKPVIRVMIFIPIHSIRLVPGTGFYLNEGSV